MTFAVTLVFADGVAQRLQASCGQNLLEAAVEAGLPLLTDCANGKCGTCVAQLVSGTVDLGAYDRAVLPDDEREAGAILTCVATVKEECVVEIPYDSSEVGAEEAALPGTVLSIAPVAAEVIRLEVQVKDCLEFHPGQYVRIRPDGGGEWRSYSMANESGASNLVFYIRLVPGGFFSSWLASAKAGDAVEMSPPRGTFFLRRERKPRLFVAGGTGLAPFLSMLEQLAADGPQQEGDTTLLVGARTVDHLFAREQLQQLAARMPALRIRYAAESGDAPGCSSGYATDLIRELDLHADTRVYLCGPPPMVEAGRQALAARGLNPKEALCERFA
ncbi:MAG: 2Fe-2S iron-sulfur cluster binding domain-containing protein [Lacisediminimonas sp.]|nr:2Fe-2S iron-sulfur cluster binding domain-containing protein [Lacisediminimonas sp.]